MPGLNAEELADLRGCNRNYVYKAHLPKNEDGKYELSNPIVRDWVLDPHIKAALATIKKSGVGGLGEGLREELEKEKLRAEINWKVNQTKKLEIEHQVMKRDLVPLGVFSMWLGHIASGIRTNFLPMGNRIARGDIGLRDRIEKAVTKAIEKTLTHAAKELRKDSERLVLELDFDD